MVTTKGKVKEWDREFRTMNSIVEEELPLVVLINKHSASASEIVSGVIQDYDRGVLLGQRSYGKGLVQNTRQIGYNSQLKLTTAKYYIPSGRCIQSVRYENGEPVDIPDAERASFTTRNGRTVLDGGGVAPDVFVPRKADHPVIKALEEAHLIFDFVTEYYTEAASVPSIEDLQFTDYDAFLRFLETRSFRFTTQSEQLLQQLKQTATQEGYELGDLTSNLGSAIKREQQKILKEYQSVITDLIEKEVAARFYYEEGRVRLGLRNDIEVKEAIQLLQDRTRYDQLLAGK